MIHKVTFINSRHLANYSTIDNLLCDAADGHHIELGSLIVLRLSSEYKQHVEVYNAWRFLSGSRRSCRTFACDRNSCQLSHGRWSGCSFVIPSCWSGEKTCGDVRLMSASIDETGETVASRPEKQISGDSHRASAGEKASCQFDAYVEVEQKETATCNTPSTGGESSEEHLHQRPTFQSEAENERRKNQEAESFRSFASVVSKNT